jgi:hypothetical protein
VICSWLARLRGRTLLQLLRHAKPFIRHVQQHRAMLRGSRRLSELFASIGEATIFFRSLHAIPRRWDRHLQTGKQRRSGTSIVWLGIRIGQVTSIAIPRVGIQQFGQIGKAKACLCHFQVSLAACIRVRALGSTDIDFGFGSIFARRSHCHSGDRFCGWILLTGAGEMH